MRRLLRTALRVLKFVFFGAASLSLLFVVLGLFGAFDGAAPKAPAGTVATHLKDERDAAAAPAPKPADEFAAVFGPKYAISDSPRVLVWRDEDAMNTGMRLIGSGVGHTRPDLVMEEMACMPDTGTSITVLVRGIFSSTVMVTAGTDAGCRGVMSNHQIGASPTAKPEP